ncbi:DUF4386 domain-containing protein [Paenibacillus sp. sptzw28]|uniref:DUF4386 domain-containing protein n=1 Tax=Paenibacillus sp. sptzw28 TaxID=715179 RepID=UPI001C6E37FA|nr:DUF4386 domain-containing protein [Paenibacillus sp. sptzw28]QYR21312.1 DUF4386 domain-containing protein [Paenibacillus sp. sptzw28]
MTNRNTEASPLFYSRATGLGLLLMAVLAMFSNFSVIEGLIVPGDAAATANNIMTKEMLFRGGFIGFVIVLILDVLVSWTLYVLLKPINKNLAMLAALFRLVYTAIFGAALFNFLNVLQLLSGAEYLTAFTTDQLHAQVMLLIGAFNNGWLIGLVLFGFHLLVVGYLIIKSRGYLPRIIGIFLVIAFAGYVIDSIAHFLLPGYTDYKTIFLLIVAIPGIIGELSLAFWLLIKGVKVELTKSLFMRN